MARRRLLSLAAVAATGQSVGGATLFSWTISALVRSGEQERYAALLAEPLERHGVTGFSDSSDGTQTDGVDKVQVTAPESEHAAIEVAPRESGLSIADPPVRFLPHS
ncbi:hypothetical protein MT355_11830 [Rathayibacter sp. VKM Ac-2929]|uniref:hypothetical protein n=1 Tax=Rathayibacter sp. VKM Ac-2929 TaxID=2929480 RepID=UPI001FB39DDE|nr:hypothetical protein [Rathayibacter sp. VKM Ac-2929]MCJ1673945.1 hypothetical protein [Rathayibacter sp. VKM Ac-2929]